MVYLARFLREGREETRGFFAVKPNSRPSVPAVSETLSGDWPDAIWMPGICLGRIRRASAGRRESWLTGAGTGHSSADYPGTRLAERSAESCFATPGQFSAFAAKSSGFGPIAGASHQESGRAARAETGDCAAGADDPAFEPGSFAGRLLGNEA